jgi:hypothetical protein
VPLLSSGSVAPAGSSEPTAGLSDAGEQNLQDGEKPLPPGFVAAGAGGTIECGDYHIESPDEPGAPGTMFVRVTVPSGKTVYEAHGRYMSSAPLLRQSLWAEFCGDLTGDGVPELVMLESSGGAHCCYTYYVVSLTAPPKRLLMWEKGDGATPLVPVKLRPGQAWQLQGSVVLYPMPFDPERGEPVLSYATSPITPVVLSLVGDKYALTSLSFPDVYRKHRQEQRAQCVEGKECDGESEVYAWIDSLAIGDWDAERIKVTDLTLRAALDRHTAAMKRLLARELGSLSAPAALGQH